MKTFRNLLSKYALNCETGLSVIAVYASLTIAGIQTPTSQTLHFFKSLMHILIFLMPHSPTGTITMLSDHLENAHSCLYISTTTSIGMGNHSSPVPYLCGTPCPTAFKLAQPLDHLSMLLIALIFNISSAFFIMLINNIIFRLHALY